MIKAFVGVIGLSLCLTANAAVITPEHTLNKYEKKIAEARERNSRFTYNEVRRQLQLWTNHAEANLADNPEALLAEYQKIIATANGRHAYLLHRWVAKSQHLADKNDLVLGFNAEEMLASASRTDHIYKPQSLELRHGKTVDRYQRAGNRGHRIE